jgi:hypothetical protein
MVITKVGLLTDFGEKIGILTMVIGVKQGEKNLSAQKLVVNKLTIHITAFNRLIS